MNFGKFLSTPKTKSMNLPLFLRKACFWTDSMSPTAKPTCEIHTNTQLLTVVFQKGNDCDLIVISSEVDHAPVAFFIWPLESLKLRSCDLVSD